ncbi:MAG: hypothetical protein PHO70_07120 [Candidatus Omnitrophica bacterium]|nr:hypothetical protein [Candidatus Omnitrophota bacterium]
MKKLILILVVLFLAGLVSWTVLLNNVEYVKSKNIASSNTKNLSKVSIGMSKVDLIKTMNTPSRIEVYSLGNHVIEFLFYRTRPLNAFLKDNDINFIPVAISNDTGNVLSLQRDFYEQVIASKK